MTLERQGDAQGIRPYGVFKRNGLHALDDGVYIDALGQAQLPGLLQGTQIVLRQKLFDFGHAPLFTFKHHIVSHKFMTFPFS